MKILLLISVLAATPASAQQPKNVRPLSAKEGEEWVIKWNRSDDFNKKEVNWKMWFKKPENFGAWTWDNEKNVAVKDGILTLTLRREEGDKLAYTSGMLKSYAKGTYGYYEARIKGAALFPGASPAFWLYSRIDDSILEKGKVRYSEIDIVEITQRGGFKEGNERIMDHNMHAILSNGEKGIKGREWRRPHRFPEAQALEYRAPFDPREDFHTYGCLVEKEEIVWYVDGKEVGRKKNDLWHREMNVALSLGLRAPYAVFKNNRLVPIESEKVGVFPTSMQVDYVRVWERKP